jgi:hypothetical protein
MEICCIKFMNEKSNILTKIQWKKFKFEPHTMSNHRFLLQPIKIHFYWLILRIWISLPQIANLILIFKIFTRIKKCFWFFWFLLNNFDSYWKFLITAKEILSLDYLARSVIRNGFLVWRTFAICSRRTKSLESLFNLMIYFLRY